MSGKSTSYNSDTIVATATAPGMGAIAVIRLSGSESLNICLKSFVFVKKGINSQNIENNKAYFGRIIHNNEIVDEVLVTYFRDPHSYTGEDAIEISCHGSEFIQKRILEICIENGARPAGPGEFTLRAFMNGKMDLSQAEAVADLIASQSASSHKMAMNQMRGGISEKIAELRTKLVEFTALIELELDFSEEDVEFANRDQFMILLKDLSIELETLLESFSMGNVIKQGIPVAIIGKPNVGKSTLLNAILNEEKAIVSSVPGTTRDAIEDTFTISGYKFRFIDTAGLRQSDDIVENIGIERTYENIKKATIILYVCELTGLDKKEVEEIIHEFKQYINDKSKHFILVANKIDKLKRLPSHIKEIIELDTVFVSAKRKENIELLTDSLTNIVKDYNITNDVIINNSRHYNALYNASQSINNVKEGFRNNVPTDLIAIDIRHALYELGSITGEVTSDEVLGNIFGKFCIGK